MKKCKKSSYEREADTILASQQERLEGLKNRERIDLKNTISDTENLLAELGMDIKNISCTHSEPCNKVKTQIKVPSWDDLYIEAKEQMGRDVELEELFSEDELAENREAVIQLKKEFNMIHHLDKVDYAIAVGAGMLGALVDILLVRVPKRRDIETKPLSAWIREYFDDRFPEDKIKKLEENSKVTYDAQFNHYRGDSLEKTVEGMSTQYHRLLSLGHDPLLGFVFGVNDIMNGTLTTIDINGVFENQSMKNYRNYGERVHKDKVEAILLQFNHLKSDIATTEGLPVPLMGLFELFQFGSVGEKKQTIAEIVQGMYYEGYDFIHFCSMSVPMMITELLTRVGYTLKELKGGKNIKEAVAVSVDRNKHPKIGTMLFLAHSIEVATNTGKICFKKNPTAINYPQWAAFAKYSYHQLKWMLIDKPKVRKHYVNDKINTELSLIYEDINETYSRMNEKYEIIVM